MQTYEWAVRYPSMVKRAAPFAANARTPVHNTLLIDVHEALLKSDPAWNNGFYAEPHAVHLGLRRHALAFALMGMCPAFYREEAWRGAGFASLDDFKRGFLEAYFLPMDPNNLLCQARKWRDGRRQPPHERRSGRGARTDYRQDDRHRRSTPICSSRSRTAGRTPR